MQDNIIKFLDLPDIIATEITSTEDRYIFIAEAKKNHIVCPQCGNITNKIYDTKWQNIRNIPIRGKLVIIRPLKKDIVVLIVIKGVSLKNMKALINMPVKPNALINILLKKLSARIILNLLEKTG
ncbi:hypothetical protein BBF96_14525 [Anoxybacter fermentans]|uniref:Transposase IS204/IS1001/IS1096/IS1165 zinc-finger domain-containing protein n=1 Tax=Anoxybacter fermentans TaxID=1323375 RepID=A0A3Q9HS81_9FIRM|nr:transposase family protein [Anoxybacter fermentans]AZR74492.1 hypothetical protein BBF96_14525 [Anoxybacter fermentans]